jgi:cytochrome bd-type quinol oxidase subunit 1
MISYIALELYFLEASILMHSFSNFGLRSCPVLSGHNIWHLFASYVTLFIHTILYYAYYCITIPGRTANTNTTIFLLWQISGAPLTRSTSSRFLSVLLSLVKQPCTVMKIISMENCQSLQSCSTAHAAIYDWIYLYMVLLLLLLLLFYYFIMKNVPGCKTTELNACSQLSY